jgi:hypothetical protein
MPCRRAPLQQCSLLEALRLQHGQRAGAVGEGRREELPGW